MADHFGLFGLPRTFHLDRAALDRAYRELQSQVHPDRHAHKDESARRHAMESATQVNEAYRTLTDPLARGRYLLHLRGHKVALENNNAMAPDFLMEQLELREAVASAREAGDVECLDGLRLELKHGMDAQTTALQIALDRENDPVQAEKVLLQLMFQGKLLHEIDGAIEAIEA